MGVGVASRRFQLTWRNTLLLVCSLGALAAFFAFAGAASAMRDVAAATPSVVSDQADYNPGATVTLTGADWGGGETVHVSVNDDVGQTWAYNTDVTADDAGNFTLRFQLPNTFVANYRVTVTGSSGAKRPRRRSQIPSLRLRPWLRLQAPRWLPGVQPTSGP